MFLGHPAWKADLVPEPNANPSISDFIFQQILIQEKASLRLQKLRESSLKSVNKCRVLSTFKENDYVLVHNRRWPQRRFPKLASPWQGPFKILKARFNSLEIMACPSLGGIIGVTLDMCKKWDLGFDEEILCEDEMVEDVEISPPNPHNSVDDEVMDEDEQAKLG